MILMSPLKRFITRPTGVLYVRSQNSSRTRVITQTRSSDRLNGSNTMQTWRASLTHQTMPSGHAAQSGEGRGAAQRPRASHQA
jgi:hypothetical protein